jgi:muramoyltetrapeptide carboxypeptidase
MIVPPRLKSGDKVAIVATARKTSMREIEPAIVTLESWGLQPVTGKSIDAVSFQFAGDDRLRKNDFQEALDNENIAAVLFARGGYGTVRIIDDIDWRKFLKRPKWLCGFSDITVIHSHLLSVYDAVSVHSPMAMNFETATFDTLESFRKILFGERITYAIESHEQNRNGVAEGRICGGNLSVLCSLNNTPSDIDTNEKILFIEDIDEHLYHVDRMMMNLKRSGKLENLACLLVGHFTDMKNKDENNPFGKTALQIIAEHVAEYEYPVCFGFPAGHEPANQPLVMGAKWKLSVGEKVMLQQLD